MSNLAESRVYPVKKMMDSTWKEKSSLINRGLKKVDLVTRARQIWNFIYFMNNGIKKTTLGDK